MGTKTYIYGGAFIGSLVGGWLGSLFDHGNIFGIWGILIGGVGAIFGIWAGYRLGQ